MKEIWKDIKDYEELYQVSNLGRVKRKKYKKIFCEKILKQKTDRRGYKRIILSKQGKTKIYLVHRLVANAFIENKYNKPYINHKDENTSNNKVDNLEWVTNSENLKYKNCLKEGKRKTSGKKVIQFDLNKNIIREYNSIAEAEEITGISRNHIGHCCNHTKYYKTAGGYKWEFKKSL